ncbi:MAG: mitochondrial protein Pet127, partial [Piptocephalis tieghemiana]
PPRLAHDLEELIMKKGVTPVRDPETGEYNVHPFLRTIPSLEDVDQAALQSFVSPSEDTELQRLGIKYNKRFASSTSSMTSFLSHLFFLVTNRYEITPTSGLTNETNRFVRYLHLPISLSITHPSDIAVMEVDKGGVILPEEESQNILSPLGHLMEVMLTTPEDEFKSFLRTSSSSSKDSPSPPSLRPNVYHYARMSDFMIRSQLDCHFPYLSGFTFDLKSRAALATRMDPANYMLHQGYEVLAQPGKFNSFDREFHDMSRSVMIKYAFQARLGAMNGIFVAYHNTRDIFGFQYISLREMDKILVGNHHMGQRVFQMIMGLMSKILTRLNERFRNKD